MVNQERESKRFYVNRQDVLVRMIRSYYSCSTKMSIMTNDVVFFPFIHFFRGRHNVKYYVANEEDERELPHHTMIPKKDFSMPFCRFMTCEFDYKDRMIIHHNKPEPKHTKHICGGLTWGDAKSESAKKCTCLCSGEGAFHSGL